LSGEACHCDDAVDVGLSKVLEFFVAVWCDNVISIIIVIVILIVVAATVTVVPDSRQDQRRIGFIDGFNGGSDPMGMVINSEGVDGDSSRSRINEFSHVMVFLVENGTPCLSGELFSSDGSRWLTEKPSSRGWENAGESERTKNLQTKLFLSVIGVIIGIHLGTQSDGMGIERGHDKGRGEQRGRRQRERGREKSLQSLLFQCLWQRTAVAELQRLHLSMAPHAVALGASLCRMYQETQLIDGLLWSFWATSKNSCVSHHKITKILQWPKLTL
jgi:hypothetical protein